MKFGIFEYGNYGHETSLYSNSSSHEIIKLLNLIPLPGEGGFFKEVLKSEEFASIPSEEEGRYNGKRSKFTLINYLMTKDQFSALHALKSDESWTFIAGAPIEICIINPNNGHVENIVLDKNNPTYVVPKDQIFGAKSLTNDSNDFSLVTCEVRPGFEYEDFVLIDPKDILQRYPILIDVVKGYTRNSVISTESQSPFLAQNLKPDSSKNEAAHFSHPPL